MRKEVIATERGYTIDKEGNVFNKLNKIVKGYLNNEGYRVFSMRHEGKTPKVSFHRMQAYAKHGKDLYNKGMVTRHLNSIKTDNNFDNICIGTHSQNMMDIPKEERIKKAFIATSHVRKYDKEEVRGFYDKCRSYKKTMAKFNISSKGTLHFILNK